MNEHTPVWFGRRPGTPPQPEPLAQSAVSVPQAPPSSAIVELRTLCLGEMDPTSVAKLTPEELTQEVERTLAEIATQRRIQLNGREQRALARELVNDMLGLGPLEPLLEDDTVTDIMVNGPERVFVERRGKLELSGVRFRDASHVAHVCQRIAGRIGRRVDESSPMVDARLKDGSRVNIVFPPLALDGPYISIRKFARHRIDFARLIEFGTLTQPVARVLEMAARARLNVIISGGTGSGKTTMLNALSRLIDIGERIVTIEDAAELQLQQPHVVRTLVRFYVLHVFVLPAAVLVLFAYHMWRVRRDGGMAVTDPASTGIDAPREASPVAGKTYSLFGVTPGTSLETRAAGPLSDEAATFSAPHLLRRLMLVFLAVFTLTIVLSLISGAPLEEPANATLTPNPAKAPWYFLWLQELVAITTLRLGALTLSGGLIGGILVPGVLLAAGVAWPFLDRSPLRTIGRWFPRERRLQNTVLCVIALIMLVLVLIGMLMRGPYWQLYWPWQAWPEMLRRL